ncbi:DUF2919 family protein [Salmonella enterica subsp. enterica]|nr:DUF2919 domain-containing protein [Salmonella enterica subsp. enterica]EIK6739670.1 DUF2919 family protein [Salmonella enterica subsp. enterica serovar Aqua]HCM8928286.1 DUF2919 family protein [Salmonella enterica subsp. enterica serovar Paratyphi B]
MKRLFSHHPSDFDNNGLLKAPIVFWVGLVVLARAWWLTGLMAMVDSDWNTSASALWPDVRFQLIALAAGVPSIVMLFIYPLRERWPGVSRVTYLLILFSLFVMVLVNLTGVVMEPSGRRDVGEVFLCLDMACLVMLWPDKRLREVFFSIDRW